MAYQGPRISGRWHRYHTAFDFLSQTIYLPQVDLKFHSTILSSLTRTDLTQTFINPSDEELEEATYSFPLYDDMSVVAFKCTIGDSTIQGLVKEREEAIREFREAVRRGENAALLAQPPQVLDAFTTSIGIVPRGSKIAIEISFMGEMQRDVGENEMYFTIPMAMFPRDGTGPGTAFSSDLTSTIPRGDLDITVDVKLERQTEILELHSPSHPATDLKIGETSAINTHGARIEPNHASAVLRVPPEEYGGHQLQSDFVLIVKALEQCGSFAFRETHPDLQDQRAIMASIVPNFKLPQDGTSEVVFVIDQSGSMWNKTIMLRSILLIFLRRLPVGISFNICSFGSYYRFMWKRSRAYDDSSLHDVTKYIETIQSKVSGTVILDSIKAAVKNRLSDLELNVVLLTDGEAWNQSDLLRYVSETASKRPVRFFPLGIGEEVSSSLMNGIARAGNGFAQIVTQKEKFSDKVELMATAVLTPCITNYTAEIQYDHSGQADGNGSLIIEEVNQIEPMPDDPTEGSWTYINKQEQDAEGAQLLEPVFEETDVTPKNCVFALAGPKILQTPYKMPAVYPFVRTNMYFLLSPEACREKPTAIIIKFTSKHGLLDMTIPTQSVGKGVAIHQLAVQKATQELEEGRGWVFHIKDKKGRNFMDRHDSMKEGIIKSEAVRLGTTFQVGCKWCPLVAVNSAQRVTGFLGNESQRSLHGWPQNPSARHALYTKRRVNGVRLCESSTSSCSYAIDRDIILPSNLENLISSWAISEGPDPGPSSGSAARSPPSNTEMPVNKAEHLMSLQTPQGSWVWKSQILDIMELEPHNMAKMHTLMDWGSILWVGEDRDSVKGSPDLLITCIAIAYLHKEWADEKDICKFVCGRALVWVNAQIAAMGGRRVWSANGLIERFGRLF